MSFQQHHHIKQQLIVTKDFQVSKIQIDTCMYSFFIDFNIVFSFIKSNTI